MSVPTTSAPIVLVLQVYVIIPNFCIPIWFLNEFWSKSLETLYDLRNNRHFCTELMENNALVVKKIH